MLDRLESKGEKVVVTQDEVVLIDQETFWDRSVTCYTTYLTKGRVLSIPYEQIYIKFLLLLLNFFYLRLL